MLKRGSKRMLAGAAVAVAVAGGAGGAIAAGGGGGGGDQKDAFLEDVAGELGVTPDELKDAFQSAGLARLDEAVAEGRLDEEQAAKIRERIESGQPPFPGQPPFRGDQGGPHHGDGMHHRGPGLETAATYLGLDMDELFQRLRDGQSLADIARAEGKSVEGLEEALVEDARERIHDFVNGTLPGPPDGENTPDGENGG